jgi:mercuric ion transport protein
VNEKSLAIGSTLAAFVASLCCLGPLILGGVGLGAVLVATFAPLRPYFLAVSAVLLALGFYFVYRKPKALPACEGEVCARDGHAGRLVKPLLWLVAAAVVALAFFPSYGGKLVGASARAPKAAIAQSETVELKISGMLCEACAAVIQHKLLETPGVAAATVDYPGGRAAVQYDPTRTDPARLIATVKRAGYQASLRRLKKE